MSTFFSQKNFATEANIIGKSYFSQFFYCLYRYLIIQNVALISFTMYQLKPHKSWKKIWMLELLNLINYIKWLHIFKCYITLKCPCYTYVLIFLYCWYVSFFYYKIKCLCVSGVILYNTTYIENDTYFQVPYKKLTKEKK